MRVHSFDFKVWFKNRRAKCRQLQKQNQQQQTSSSSSTSVTQTTTSSSGNLGSIVEFDFDIIFRAFFSDVGKITTIAMTKMKTKPTTTTNCSTNMWDDYREHNCFIQNWILNIYFSIFSGANNSQTASTSTLLESPNYFKMSQNIFSSPTHTVNIETKNK